MRITKVLSPVLPAALAVLLSAPARAEEGMWTFDAFPSEEVGRLYGFSPSPEWLEHVRLSSVRLARGCSASFVSPEGLVMTNHHCAHSCIEQLSTAKRDHVADGFLAARAADEVRCPEMEANQLTGIEDVTARVQGALAGLEGEEYEKARRAVVSAIEKECAGGQEETVRCDVVTLYRGGRHHLYRYRRFQDVRLVFAPEFSIAFFGGDPDNFMFPRWDLDVTFLRVYEDGRPAPTRDYFPWSPAGTKEGDLTFVSGHPGSTSRQETVAQLEFERDHATPERLMYLSELRGMLTEFQQRGPEQKRISSAMLFGVENSIKALTGRQATLLDDRFTAVARGREAEMRARVAADPAMQARYGRAWADVESAVVELHRIHVRHALVEGARGFSSDLFGYARKLLRATDEALLPNGKRLREYTDARLPALRQDLASTAPVYPELEIATLAFSLVKLREKLGPDDPFVRLVLGPKSPRELASELVRGSTLGDPSVRRRLLEGGKAAVDASDDPMIRLARLVDPEARALRARVESEVDAVLERSGDLLAQARFALEGAEVYPDATFSLRLSFGRVKGWNEERGPVAPYTTLGGAFERHTGREPFDLPPSWLKARERLDLSVPFNFVTTNDIIGGNSGSPVIDREARVVGLVFDGNIHSLGGDYWFEPERNRTVAVDSRGLLHALERVYRADRVVEEIRKAARP